MKAQKQTVRLTVDVEFDVFEGYPIPPLTARQKDEIVNNVVNGLVDQVNHVSIVPDDIDGYTRKITVRVAKSKKFTSYDFVENENGKNNQ